MASFPAGLSTSLYVGGQVFCRTCSLGLEPLQELLLLVVVTNNGQTGSLGIGFPSASNFQNLKTLETDNFLVGAFIEVMILQSAPGEI